MRRMHRSVAVLVVVALTGGARAEPPAAMAPAAREHFQRGIDLYMKNDYRAAIAELQQGYAIDPSPEILFAWAQAERLAGDCATAIALYQRFVATGPPELQVRAAEENRASCEQTLASQTQTAPTPTPAIAVTRSVPPGATPPWYADVTGDVLAGTGTLTIAAGAGLLVLSAKNLDAAPGQGTEGQFRDAVDRGQLERTIGIGALIAGAAVLGTGIWHYATRPTRRESSAVVQVWQHGDGWGVAIGGRLP